MLRKMRRLTEITRKANKANEAKPSGNENLWIRQLLDSAGLTADLNYNADILVTNAS